VVGLRNGRRSVRAPPASAPATEWIIDTSSNSRGVKGGRIEGKRWASIDLPAPGAPLINLLCTVDPHDRQGDRSPRQ
jgi:hypothetical protein